MTTWFTSDTHFGHRHMARLRGFAPGAESREDVMAEQVAAHDQSIIDAWNKAVQPGDTVWHLGDLAQASPQSIAHVLVQLRGTIRLVAGNHDRAHPMFGEKSISVSQWLLSTRTFEWVGPFAAVKIMPTRALGRVNGSTPHRVALSHFPYEADHTDDPRETQWRLRDEGNVLLHGHLHTDEGTHPDRPRQIHVGWDTWHRPISAHEIAQIIEESGWTA